MDKFEWSFKRHFRVAILITLITVISDLLTGGFGALSFIINMKLIDMIEPSAIGIIGGADGPTTMFYSGNPFGTLLISKIILLVILLLLFVPIKKYLLKVINN